MSTPLSLPTTNPDRVTVSYRRGKALDLGCTQHDCQLAAGSLEIREGGDIVFQYKVRHETFWHHNSRSLREMCLLVAYHDLSAFREMLGPDLIRRIVEAENK